MPQNPCIDTDFIFCTLHHSPYKGTISLPLHSRLEEHMCEACNLKESYEALEGFPGCREDIERAYRKTHWMRYVEARSTNKERTRFVFGVGDSDHYDDLIGFVAIPKAACNYTHDEADLALSLFVQSCYAHYLRSNTP